MLEQPVMEAIERTAASAERMRLVVALAEGRGTLRCGDCQLLYVSSS